MQNIGRALLSYSALQAFDLLSDHLPSHAQLLQPTHPHLNSSGERSIAEVHYSGHLSEKEKLCYAPRMVCAFYQVSFQCKFQKLLQKQNPVIKRSGRFGKVEKALMSIEFNYLPNMRTKSFPQTKQLSFHNLSYL